MSSQQKKSTIPTWLKISGAILWGLLVLAAGLLSGIYLAAYSDLRANSPSTLDTALPPTRSDALVVSSTPLLSVLTETSVFDQVGENPYPYPFPEDIIEATQLEETQHASSLQNPSETPTVAFPTRQPLTYTAVPLDLPVFPLACIPEQVVIIAIDGLRADSIFEKQALPVVEQLALEGTYDWHARTIQPSITNPAYASMFSGLTPEHHGVFSNLEKDYPFPFLQVKSIFQYINEKYPQAINILLLGKKRMAIFNQPDAVDISEFNDSSKLISVAAVNSIQENDFKLAFIHLPDPDTVGHDYSFESENYIEAVRAQNPFLEDIIKAMKDKGIYDTSLVIITSDHGGEGLGHGDGSPLDMTIPWVMVGPCVKKGFDIQSINAQVRITDITPTILYALGIPVPADLDGRPILEAFDLAGATAPEGSTQPR
jgi:hypothetical protein